ncbi:MAG TPA: hypothetical protein VK796_07585, partial [Cytophaga sp.]|nr:hypothetical protein [Cytophaga sp.]
LDNAIDTIIDLEIRILTTKHFDTTYLYALKHQDSLWTGELYVLEYLTQKLINKKNFVPINGWHKFQSAIITYDLLACDINKIKIVDSCNFIHPREFSFQIISPRYMKIVSFGSFYHYLYDCNIKQKEFDQMAIIMNSLFEKNKHW